MEIIQINTLVFALWQLVCIVTPFTPAEYQIVDSSRVRNIFKSLKSRTLTHCLLTCGKTTSCVLVNYNKSTKECQLCSEFKNKFNVESDEGWIYIQMIPEEETVLPAIQTTQMIISQVTTVRHLNNTSFNQTTINNNSHANINNTATVEAVDKSGQTINNKSIHFLGFTTEHFVYKRPINSTDLTLCFWFKVEGEITREQALISLPLREASHETGCNNFFISIQNHELKMRRGDTVTIIKRSMLYNQSYHFCFSMNTTEYDFYVSRTYNKFKKRIKRNVSPITSDLIVLGTEMDLRSNGFCLSDNSANGQYYQGFVMDVNIWDRVLGKEDIECIRDGCIARKQATIPWNYFLQFPIEKDLIKLSSVDLSSNEN